MEDDQQTKGEKMDEAPDAYVAEDLYEDEDLGITVGVSPTRELQASPPRVETMEVDESSRSLKGEFSSRYGDILELLLQRASGDVNDEKDCGAAGILEAKMWNTNDKVTYIIKLLHLAKEHGLFALVPSKDGPLMELVAQLAHPSNASEKLRERFTSMFDGFTSGQDGTRTETNARGGAPVEI